MIKLLKIQMQKYKLSPHAESDLLHLTESTIKSWGIEQAKQYALSIESVLDKLSQYPEISIQRNELYSTARSFPVGKHIIYYQFKNDIIEVARIIHQSMDPVKHL